MQAYTRIALALALLSAGCGVSPTPGGVSLVPAGMQAMGAATRIAPDLPKGDRERPATLLSYLPIDDGMDEHVDFYLNTLERTTSARIHNVAFTDRNGPDNTLAYLIGPDTGNAVTSRKAFPAPGVKELTTNKPETLAGAVNWAYDNYPGKFKAFSYLGHGGGFMGIGTDATPAVGDQGQYMLTVADMGAGLKKGLKGRKLNLIHLHACLMANVEAAYELRDVSEVLFASEDVVGAHQEGTEKPTEIMNKLLQGDKLDARAIARETVIKVNPTQNPYGFATGSAIDLDRIAEVKSALNVLSRDLMAALPAKREAIAGVYMGVPEFKNYPGSGQRDLWTFCKQLQKVNDPTLTKDALAVTAAMRKALLHTRDQEGSAANGLSVFMPRQAKELAQWKAMGYTKSRFAQDTLWDEFLTKLIG